MKATIIIDKVQALLDGIDAEGARTIDFTPDLLRKEQRECLARCKTDKNGSFEVNPNWDNDLRGSWCNKMPKVSSADVYTLATLLDSRIALEQQIAAEQVKKDTEKVMAYAALKDEAFYTASYYGPEFCEAIIGELLPAAKRIGHQETLDRIERIKTEILPVKKAAFDAKKKAEEQAALAREAKVSHDREARKKAEAEKAAREKDQIEKWVSEPENAPDEMKDRFAAGVLDRDEVLDAMRDQAYACLSTMPRYQKLKKDDICDEGDDDGYRSHDVTYEVYDKKTLTAEEFAHLKVLRGLAPDAVVEPRAHVGECEQCESEIERTGFMVRITVGEFEFSREYGLPE